MERTSGFCPLWMILVYHIMGFFTSSISTLSTLTTAIGAGLGVWGGINLMEGYGNDNPGAKAQKAHTNNSTFPGGQPPHYSKTVQNAANVTPRYGRFLYRLSVL